MKHEIKEITILRSIAISFLLLTHLCDYVDLPWLRKIYPFTADLCLSIFVFISGYCLALGKDIDGFKSLVVYFKKRLVRIYSLYIPALVIFFILYDHYYPNKVILFIDHLLGLQLFLARPIKPYLTIWYIGLIIPYYFLYGVSNYLNNTNRLKLGENTFKSITNNTSDVLIFFFLVLSILSIYFKFDARLVFYFPAFIAGVFLSEKQYLSRCELKLQSFLYLTISSIVLLLLFYVSKLVASLSFLYPVLKFAVGCAYVSMIAISFTFVTQLIVVRTNTLSKHISILAYSSYAIYLFHKPVLDGVKWFLSYLQIGNSYVLLALYPLLVFPFILLPISYVIQKNVDRAIKLHL